MAICASRIKAHSRITVRIAILIVILFLTLLVRNLTITAIAQNEAIIHDSKLLPVPEGYIHRPLLEFFTGLSCPVCMEGPHQDIDRLIKDEGGKGEVFNAVVFHELNGGGVDDLATDESFERMRHYQPGVSGTPDAEFDGGYIELGGVTSPGGSVDYSNALDAIKTCEKRYEVTINPLHPLQSIKTKFKFVNLYIEEYFYGDRIGVTVKVEYLGTNVFTLRERLNAELYVFIVEDNVPAYSIVTNQIEINNNVFRGYAIKGEKITLNRGENTTLSGEWVIPKDLKVPVKPYDLYAIAAVFDLDDTSSQDGNKGNKASVPRCIQSASARSTSIDIGNKAPVIKDIKASAKGDKIRVSADISDDDGLVSAYVLYTTDNSGLNWSYSPLKMLGEEICDESGVCYAYGSGMAECEFKPPKGWDGRYVIIATDTKGLKAVSSIMNYTFVKTGDRNSGAEGVNLRLDPTMVIIIVGIAITILALYLGIKGTSTGKDGVRSMDKKTRVAASIAITVVIILVIMYAFYSSGIFGTTSKAPDFTVEDTDGNIVKLSDYKGRVILLDIMSSVCSGCEDAMKTLLEIYPKYKDNTVFMSVSVDPQTDSRDVLKRYKEQTGAEWIFTRDYKGEVLTRYGVSVIPIIIIIDASGNIIYKHVGPPPKAELEAKLQDAIQNSASPISITTTTGTLGLVAISILTGIGMFFSPCAFPLLPGYISYYLTRNRKEGGIKEGLKAGSVASLGIISVFIIIGILVALAGQAISQYFIYLEPIVGVVLIILGIVLFMEIPIPIHRITLPFKRMILHSKRESLAEGEKAEKSGFIGLFGYGVGYAAGAASCTAPLLLGMIFLGLQAGGFLGALIMFAIFALSMAVLMIIFTIIAAISGHVIFARYARAMRYIEKASAIVLVIVGIYFLWYYVSVAS